jgi:CelD/BcsL family acetyltransferase involved in cellulose biosynthesis
MDSSLRIDAVRPSELGSEERAAWRAFRAARPELASPYFDLRYVLAAGEIAPHAAVAVVRRAGRIEAFLPFQRRAGLIQPLGAPLSDYHGLVSAPGAQVSLAEIMRGIGGRRLRFGGLIGTPPDGAGLHQRSAMVSDLTGGFDAYLEGRRKAGYGGELKDKRRRARALERDHGEVSFTFGRDPGDVLELVVRLKRDQWRRTGQHDVLASSWTGRLLERLAKGRDDDFGLRFATLRAGDKLIAAEVGLLSGDAYHLWFPVYDPDFSKYSPGALMTLETLRAAAEQGVRKVDFGPMGEAYKRVFADPATPVWEGQVHVRGVAAACWGVVDQVAAPAPFIKDAWRAAVRRIDRIAACEPTFNGQMGATALTVAHLGKRHRRKLAWLTLAAALPLGALAFD